VPVGAPHATSPFPPTPPGHPSPVPLLRHAAQDLVPDMTNFYKQYKSIKPWLEGGKEGAGVSAGRAAGTGGSYE
jgi:hypothetical protein